jgi:hypothetical protein
MQKDRLFYTWLAFMVRNYEILRVNTNTVHMRYFKKCALHKLHPDEVEIVQVQVLLIVRSFVPG